LKKEKEKNKTVEDDMVELGLVQVRDKNMTANELAASGFHVPIKQYLER